MHAADAAARAEAGLKALLDEAAQEILGQEAEEDEHDDDDREEDERDEDPPTPCHQPSAGRESLGWPSMESSSKMLTFIDSYNFEV